MTDASPLGTFRVSQDDQLKFYALYKQGTVGKCNAPSPGFFDFAGKAKWFLFSLIIVPILISIFILMFALPFVRIIVLVLLCPPVSFLFVCSALIFSSSGTRGTRSTTCPWRRQGSTTSSILRASWRSPSFCCFSCAVSTPSGFPGRRPCPSRGLGPPEPAQVREGRVRLPPSYAIPLCSFFLRIADGDKLIFDWISEGNVDKVKSLVQADSSLLAKKSVSSSPSTSSFLLSSSLNFASSFFPSSTHLFFRDDDGRTALHWAVDGGHLSLARFLLEQGAQVNAQVISFSFSSFCFLS